jgi:hypothetical protein
LNSDDDNNLATHNILLLEVNLNSLALVFSKALTTIDIVDGLA